MIFTAKSAEFLRWAEEKEKNIPQNSDGILVNIHDINNVKTSEIAKIKETIYKYNSCIYSSKIALKSNTNLLKFVELVGMRTYDCNNIDSNEISTITPLQNSKINYIPYTDKPLNWHTDGYYDKKSIFSWLLHCVNPATQGGENYLLDHELVLREYLLRNDDINNLMAEDALTIPESKYTSRSEISTYIFSFKNKYKRLHMRFSMRKDNIGTSAKANSAVIKLREIIEGNCAKYSLTYKLQKNEGIITNNILHGRKAFKDDKVKRKLLRIRSYERL
jgi:alpha-ketoglutarate-dependent taurine dioxygenase